MIPANIHLTIERLEVRPLNLNLARPVETASGTMKTAPLVLIDVLTREGIIGCSYLRTFTSSALRSLATLLEDLQPLICGRPVEPAAIEELLQRQFRFFGVRGHVGAAIAGIDMALWDALAKAAALPLVQLLGGTPKPIPAYASLRSMDARSAAQEAQQLVSRGFRAVKVKLGRDDLETDREVVALLRSALGDEVRILADYNQSLSTSEALVRGRMLESYDVYWMEEPICADDFAGHAKIAQALSLPVQAGESWWGIHDMEHSVAANATDYVMFNAMKIGGVSGWMRATALAHSHGLAVSSHTFPEISSHLLGVTPNAHYLEYLDHAGPILATPVQHRNGDVLIADQPGSGIVWDERVITQLSSNS